MKKLLIAFVTVLALTSLTAASAAELTVFPTESSTRIDSFTSYEVEIENVGPVEDVYSMSTDSPREVSFAPQRVPEEGTLAPGETETVNVWYNPELNKEEGTYSFSVTATSRASGKKYSADATVNVIKEHKVDVAVSQSSRTGCLGENVQYDVKVTNKGIQKEEFQLSSDYGKFSQKRLTLEEDESRTVELSVSSENPVERNFNIVAASTTSYAQDIQNVDFKAETCFASDVSVTPKNKEVAAFTTAEYTVNVRNTGTKADKFTLSSSVGELKATKMEIGPGQSKEVSLEVTPTELGKQQISVQADSSVTSSGTTTLNVYNGMDASISMADRMKVCENEEVEYETVVENTGEAEESFVLTTSRGNLSETEVELEPGESEELNVELDSSNFKAGSYPVKVSATPQTFGKPVKTSTGTLKVENCWDLQMNIVPEVASVGENRSTIYRINLRNTGTKENTYSITKQGPDWVDVKPEEVTVGAGQQESSYIYAGAPFQKKGEVKITATATGRQVEKSRTVDLLIDQEIEDSIKDGRNSLTGSFAKQVSSALSSVGAAGNLAKLGLSILVGAVIVLVVFLRG